MKFIDAGLSLVVFALTIGGAAATPHVNSHHGRHHEIAKRAEGHVDLHKRYSDSRWSFYDVGLGACGEWNVRDDFIVALNSAQFDEGGGYPGVHCFKYITMQLNGKTARARIMDRCPGCPWGGLDLSRGLFTYFAAESVGIIHGSWSFEGSGGGGGDAPATTKKTTTKWTPPPTTWEPPTTTTKKPRTSTSTWVWTPTTTSTSTRSKTTTKESSSETTSKTSTETKTTETSASATTSSANYSEGAASGLAIPVATGVISTDPGAVQNVNNINVAMVGLGALIVAGAEIN